MPEFTSDLWTFSYKKGPALVSGTQVRAKDSATAYRVAETWCKQKNFRFLGQVWPAIVADESILNEKPVPAAEPLPDTGGLSKFDSAINAAKTLIGR